MVPTSNPIDETAELIRTSRALLGSVRKLQHSLVEICDETVARIVESEALIGETDRIVERWGGLASRPPK
jgi:hypothetical protein